MKNKLFDICQKNDISLSSEQLEQFETFYDYMLEMNQVMNLTSITDEDEVVLKHFFDSMSLINYYEVKNGSRVIDVGTGAGFPGIPLAILLPNVHFTLMDSLNKRILFLKDVVKKSGLNNVECIHSRAEELAKDMNYREQFDLCVSRAVANLSPLLPLSLPRPPNRLLPPNPKLLRSPLNLKFPHSPLLRRSLSSPQRPLPLVLTL